MVPNLQRSPIGRRAGFTLIELMIVVAVIAVIVAMALPSILRSKMASNEASAIASLKAIATVEEQYRQSEGIGKNYSSSLQELANLKYIDTVLGGSEFVEQTGGDAGNNYPANAKVVDDFFNGIGGWVSAWTGGSIRYERSDKSGYFFAIFGQDPGGSGDTIGWSVTAWPTTFGKTGNRSFYCDETGVIRFVTDQADTNPINETAPPIE